MHQVTPDEFRVFQGDLTFWLSRLFPSGRKSDLIPCNGKDPVVGNGDPVGITPQIFNGIAKTMEGFFDVRAPVFFIKPVFPFFPVAGIAQFFTGRGKSKGAVFVKGSKLRHIFALELVTQDFYRDKEFTGGSAELSITGKPAPGNNAVHMYMIIQFLVPCMEDLDDPGCCPEPFFIRRQFQERFGAAPVKKAVKKLLVAVNKGIQFMREREHHMEIGGIDDLGPAFVHPDLLLGCLAVWAVTVAAGIIVYFQVSAFRTLADIVPQAAGPAV